MFEDFGARSESAREACIEEVMKSDVYIGIFNKKFSKPTKNEYEKAWDEYKGFDEEIFIYIREKDSEKREKRLSKFLEEIENRHLYRDFGEITELEENIDKDIHSYLTRSHKKLKEIKKESQRRKSPGQETKKAQSKTSLSQELKVFTDPSTVNEDEFLEKFSPSIVNFLLETYPYPVPKYMFPKEYPFWIDLNEKIEEELVGRNSSKVREKILSEAKEFWKQNRFVWPTKREKTPNFEDKKVKNKSVEEINFSKPVLRDISKILGGNLTHYDINDLFDMAGLSDVKTGDQTKWRFIFDKLEDLNDESSADVVKVFEASGDRKLWAGKDVSHRQIVKKLNNILAAEGLEIDEGKLKINK